MLRALSAALLQRWNYYTSHINFTVSLNSYYVSAFTISSAAIHNLGDVANSIPHLCADTWQWHWWKNHKNRATVDKVMLETKRVYSFFDSQCVKGEVKKVWHLYSAYSEMLRYGSHSFYPAYSSYLPLPRKRLPDGAIHLITAYYLFIDPERMKGWVDSWSTADAVYHINALPVSCMSSAGQEKSADQIPTFFHRAIHTTNDRITDL